MASTSGDKPYRERIMKAYRKLANRKIYVGSAFESTSGDEVYMFIKFYYFVIKYDPAASPKDSLVYGPYFLSKGFPHFEGTVFQEFRVDAAFGCHGMNEAILFSQNCCAKIRYDPVTRGGEVDWPIKFIGEMFPFLRGSIFGHSVDAAFESSTVNGQAYLFKDSKYALIDYSKGRLIDFGLITDLFPCLIDTIFATKIGAAFASRKCHQVCLFKDNNFVRLRFHPRKRTRIIEGPSNACSNWPSFNGIVPQDGRGLACVGEKYRVCLGPRFWGHEGGPTPSVRGDANITSANKHKVGNAEGTSVRGDANIASTKKHQFGNVECAGVSGDANIAITKKLKLSNVEGARVHGDANIAHTQKLKLGNVEGASVGGDANITSTKKRKLGKQRGASVSGDANTTSTNKDTFVNDQGVSIARDTLQASLSLEDKLGITYPLWPKDEKNIIWINPKLAKDKKKMPLA